MSAAWRRLTLPQQALLAEIRETGGLYIASHGRYGRTVRALVKAGFVRCDDRDYSNMSMDHFVPVAVPRSTAEGEG